MESFYNYKTTFSIILLALVDARYKFITVNVGSYGRNSDGGVFAKSSLGQRLENGTLNLPVARQLPNSDIIAPFVFYQWQDVFQNVGRFCIW